MSQLGQITELKQYDQSKSTDKTQLYDPSESTDQSQTVCPK